MMKTYENTTLEHVLNALNEQSAMNWRDVIESLSRHGEGWPSQHHGEETTLANDELLEATESCSPLTDDPFAEALANTELVRWAARSGNMSWSIFDGPFGKFCSSAVEPVITYIDVIRPKARIKRELLGWMLTTKDAP